MKEDPDVVNLYIPLMKDLNMSYSEIQSLSRHELNGLLLALDTYTTMHAFDGYTSESIGDLARNDASIHGRYAKTQEVKARMEERMGIQESKKKPMVGFKTALGIK